MAYPGSTKAALAAALMGVGDTITRMHEGKIYDEDRERQEMMEDLQREQASVNIALGRSNLESDKLTRAKSIVEAAGRAPGRMIPESMRGSLGPLGDMFPAGTPVGLSPDELATLSYAGQANTNSEVMRHGMAEADKTFGPRMENLAAQTKSYLADANYKNAGGGWGMGGGRFPWSTAWGMDRFDAEQIQEARDYAVELLSKDPDFQVLPRDVRIQMIEKVAQQYLDWYDEQRRQRPPAGISSLQGGTRFGSPPAFAPSHGGGAYPYGRYETK